MSRAGHGQRARRAIAIIGAACALSLTGAMLSNRDLRALIWAVWRACAHTLTSLPSLLASDGAATARSAGVMLLALGAMVAPPLRYFRHAPRRHLLWMPLWLGVLGIAAAVGPLGMALPEKWLALLLTGAVGWVGAARSWMGWTAFLPMLVAIHPTITNHGGPLSDVIWPPAALMRRCAANDGVRPTNFSADVASTRHYAVTQIDDDLIVMTGERGSYRLRRDGDGRFALDGAFGFDGNLWQGSLGEGKVFLTHRGSGLVTAAAADVRNGKANFRAQQIPDLPGAGPELDLLDAVYEPSTRSVFLTELVRGGLWEVSLTDDTMRHYDLEAFYLQAVRRNLDAMLVGISTTELLVFDPRRRVVTERLPAALGAGGLDVCQRDGAAIVADYAGRLRLFRLGPAGRYEFERGVSLSSPRRVGFSPDCAWIAVSSGDDQTVYVIRREDFSIWHTFRLGPALRDVVYTRPREVAIVDACTVTVLPGGEP